MRARFIFFFVRTFHWKLWNIFSQNKCILLKKTWRNFLHEKRSQRTKKESVFYSRSDLIKMQNFIFGKFLQNKDKLIFFLFFFCFLLKVLLWQFILVQINLWFLLKIRYHSFLLLIFFIYVHVWSIRKYENVLKLIRFWELLQW